MPTHSAYVGLIEAAYRTVATEQDWLAGLLDVASPLMDLGAGVSAISYRVLSSGGVAIDDLASTAEMRELERASRLYLDQATGPIIGRMFRRTDAVFLRREAAGRPEEHPADYEYWKERGVEEAFSVVGYDVSGHGVMLSAIARRGARVPARKRQLLRCVAAHLASAVRLRRAPARSLAGDLDANGGEAVLGTDGKVIEVASGARGPRAKRALERAAVLVGRARSRALSEDEAVQIWRALWAGRWTLVDRESRGDRCYLVARRNEPTLPEPKALSMRERQVIALARMGHSQKFIAFELGLAGSTVAGHLASGLRKLGLTSVVDLVKLG